MDDIRNMNTAVLAYMGDAVYEQAVREHIIRKRPYNAHRLHLAATAFVKAQAQADVIKKMFDELTEEEQRLVKRARNRKTTAKARSADPVTYRWATAFEALVGYLYLAGDSERLEYVVTKAIGIVEDGRNAG